ncbi:MAG: serine/threonine protein kinase [Myxococcales bacterium]|nr:serine/threonine protein kinase [Myxococcales bacterium]
MAQQKYSIVQKIDAGGMAEVWKGKATSLRGFEKLVAIKRVLPNLAKNKKFISMFLDEARLSLYLNHANVVQTFDIGVADHAYFIVMEWVDGTNLKGVLDVARERGWHIPREQAAYIAVEICKGLSHAHNRRDPKDRPLHIVHRDISPPNVLLSREGEVKLVDFGLAKAASQLTQTDPGVVKGKFSYLCPEATLGRQVDERADIFSTGIVLWEMLAGRRLFDGATDLKTVELVREAKVPSIRAINAEVEPELERVIMKALAREPRDRYQTTEALGHDLSRYLFQNRLLVTSYDIAVLVKRVMAERDKATVPRPDTSNIKALEAEVRQELGKFTSVDDLEKLEFRSVLEDDPDAALAGIPHNAEDPRAWAEEMGVVTGDETIIDPGPHGRDDVELLDDDLVEPILTPATDAPAAQVAAPAPARERKVTITAPPDDALPGLPAPGPRRGDAAAAAMERRARAEAAAAAAQRALQHQGESEGSVMTGVVLGVIGAVALGGAAWYFLF